jgi:NADH dehydrogenase [ubiquinone] 1 alpha subcomplex assembly factor 7
LAEVLAERIRSGGPLSVEAYMAAALGDARHGYYATRDPLGAQGDFITAPEISQIFGELVGLWCVDFWQRWDAPARVVLAEIGPGRGTLMADALRAARVAPGFAQAIELHLVETSPTLRAVQAKTLAQAAPHWHDAVDALPPGPLLLIANEFLDALPIRQLVRAAEGWHERLVGLAGEGEVLVFTLDPAPAEPSLVPPRLRAAPPGAVFEVRATAESLARTLAARLAAEGGAALFVDYGHQRSACGDTLQAVRRHRRHEVLAEPGMADLTAHVDFAAFAASAEAGGARVWGPVTQGAWLKALGIEARAARLLAQASAAQAEEIRSACRRLTDPAAMGALFKVLALTHPGAPAPDGFASQEQS